MINFTIDQQNAIKERNCNLLVSAAAGSGKTAVLVERILKLILDDKIDINKLLVVTFTRAAASEMKERIKEKIEKKLQEAKDDENLKRQMLLLNESSITTIDAFCKNIITSNIHLLEYDSGFRVIDSVENDILKNEVIDDLFLNLYNQKDDSFLNIVDCYSTKRADEDLKKLILDINNFSNQSPFPNKWLFEKCEFFNIQNKDEMFYIENYLFDIFNDAKIKFDFLLNAIEKEVAKVEKFKEFENYAKNYRELLEEVKILNNNINLFLENVSLENLQKLKNSKDNFSSYKMKSFRKPSKMEEFLKEFYDLEKKKLDSFKDEIYKEISKMDVCIDDIKKESEIIYPYIKKICDITALFTEKYQKRKKELNVVDFSDIEHLALDVLTTKDENNNLIPSNVAIDYRNKYKEIFIDEYQDSNSLQEMILSIISRKNPPNRFMVGDVKQSIYRFRQAEPEIFIQKYNLYDDFNENKKSLYKKIMLYENFRSRKEILEDTNFIFKKIMNKQTAELDYTDKEKLNPKADFKDILEKDSYVSSSVEIHLVNEQKDDNLTEVLDEDLDIKAFKIEAIEIANIIYDMINNKNFKILDKQTNEYRNVTYKDIVILMRSPYMNAKILEQTFLEYNIPFYAETKGGYFESFEVDTIINLLKIIDNPLQDIPFVAVMRSCIYNFTTKELAKIRLIDKNLNFYNLLLKILDDEKVNLEIKTKQKIKRFIDDLKLFSKKSILIPTDELLWFIFKHTGYLDYVSILEMGQIRKNNLILLFEKAKEYEEQSYKGLFNFINYIEKIKLNSDLSSSKTIFEDANVVSLMSIHKSKGLEFPVVILSNIDKKFNFKSSNDKIVMHQKLGFGMVIYDFYKKISFNTMMKRKIENILKKEQIAEEMRLLYVAMTRAKEKLIITARIKNKDILDEFKEKEISNFEILNSKSFLEWILLCIKDLKKMAPQFLAEGKMAEVLQNEDAKFQLVVKNKQQEILKQEEIKEKIAQNKPSIILKKEENKTLFEEIFKQRFQKEYKFKQSATKPSSISVSEIKKMIENEEELATNYYPKDVKIDVKMPNFMQNKIQDFTPAQKGSLTHLVMQLLNFKDFDIENIKENEIKEKIINTLNKLTEKNIITIEEKNVINVKKIVKFIQSDIFKEILKADKNNKLYKEKAINYSLNLSEIYENEKIKENEKIMVLGIIDLFYETKDGFVLLDYKTDYVTEENIEQIKKKYKIQLELYQKAIERNSQKKVIKKGLYLFSINKFQEIN